MLDCADKCKDMQPSTCRTHLTVYPRTEVRTSHSPCFFLFFSSWHPCSTDRELDSRKLSHIILQAPIRPQYHIRYIAGTISMTHDIGWSGWRRWPSVIQRPIDFAAFAGDVCRWGLIVENGIRQCWLGCILLLTFVWEVRDEMSIAMLQGLVFVNVKS